MISVSNSYKKRLFLKLRSNISLKRKEEVERLKQEIEEEIYKIELQSDIDKRDYNQLCIFGKRDNAETISLFYYQKEIESALKKLKQELKENYSQEREYKTFIEALEFLENDICKLLVGDFKTIKNYIQKDNISVLIYRDNPKDAPILYKKYKEVFEELYNRYLSGDKKIKRSFFELFDNMNVCPYCNRNYINPIYKDSNRKDKDDTSNDEQSPDIEHFFPKSIYPFLSLSISNLLPSCGFCNKIKSNVDTLKDFKSPYEIEPEDFRFSFELQEVDKVKIKIKSTHEVKRNIEVLDLENMYNRVHSGFIDEIFLDIKKYPKHNQKFLESFDVSTDDIMDMKYKEKFRNYYKEKELHKQPLSKMTRDLFVQIREDEE